MGCRCKLDFKLDAALVAQIKYFGLASDRLDINDLPFVQVSTLIALFVRLTSARCW